MRIAFLARYAHQDLRALVNRPLSPLEWALFERATLKHVQSEFEARAGGFDHTEGHD